MDDREKRRKKKEGEREGGTERGKGVRREYQLEYLSMADMLVSACARYDKDPRKILSKKVM